MDDEKVTQSAPEGAPDGKKKLSNTTLRLITGLVYALVLLAFFVLKIFVHKLCFDVLIVVFTVIGTYEMIRKNLNPELELEGVLLTMYDARTNLSAQVAEEARNYFGGKVYQTQISRSVRLSEAPSHGLPGIIYDPKSRGAQEYQALAEEFLRRQQ